MEFRIYCERIARYPPFLAAQQNIIN